MGLFDKVMDDWLGDPFGTYTQASAASGAAQTQAAFAEKGIDEQRRQFDIASQRLDPYAQAGLAPLQQGLPGYAQTGQNALAQQQAYLGMLGPEAQQAFINNILNSPEYQTMLQEGETAMLQNASATGGLRGGNTQRALMEYRPQLLQQLLNQQYGRLGGLAGLGYNATSNLAQLGQASAAGQATAGLETGSAVAGLLGDQGTALGQSQINASRGSGGLGSFLNLRNQFMEPAIRAMSAMGGGF